MGQEGREPANMPPEWLDDLARLGAAERPLSSDDITGGVPPERFRRHLAMNAWKFIADYGSANEPLPAWVVDYLKDVAGRISRHLGPKGALNREDAYAALGIDGKAWPENSPISVYLAMQQWIDSKECSGPKDAAKRYIRERMAEDKEARSSTVIRIYTEGKRLWLSEG